MNAVAQNAVRLTRLIGRLPDVGSVVVLKLADLRHGLVVHDERRILAVGALEFIDEAQHIVRLQCGRKRTGHMTAADFCEQAQGLTHTSAVEEGILLGIGQRLAELLDDVAFQIESAVIEQLLGHLDGNVQLVGIQQDLGEGGIGELERTAFLDPCGGRLGGRDIDLVLTGSGDHMAQAAHDVLLRQGLNQAAVILLGHEVAAIGIHAFLQNVADLTEVGA